MKIGEFSKKTEISIDAIRHYITLGLLVPAKEGKYFNFDDRCIEDLEKIKEMKDMSFSLQEIKNILLLSRFSKLSLGQERQHYRSFFKNKLKEIIEERSKIEEQTIKLENKIKEIDVQFMQAPVKLGVALSFLPNLYCPDCQVILTLDDADIKDNMIVDGHMSCKCGYQLVIKDGIIINNESMKASEETDETFFVKYIDETNKHFLDNIYSAMEWCNRVVDYAKIDNEVLLELGVGHGIFLSHVYNDLSENVKYVAVDYDYNKLRYIKKVLERSGIKKNIVFICVDYKKIPMKAKTVDYALDFFGMTNYSFRNNEILHDAVNHYYKDSCTLLGSYMLFDKFKKNEEISPDKFHLFKKENIIKYLKALGFNKREEYLVGYSEEGEKDDILFDVTNRVYVYGYIGDRNK